MAEPPSPNSRCANPQGDVCCRGTTVVYTGAPIRVVSCFPWNPGPKKLYPRLLPPSARQTLSLPCSVAPQNPCPVVLSDVPRGHGATDATLPEDSTGANFSALASGQTFCIASVFIVSHWRRLFDLRIALLAHRVASRASQFNESPGRDGLGGARDAVSFLKRRVSYSPSPHHAWD